LKLELKTNLLTGVWYTQPGTDEESPLSGFIEGSWFSFETFNLFCGGPGIISASN
jgi:hypothetical protein